MVRGITFDKQLLTSKDLAHQTNYFYQGKRGVTKGCTITLDVDGNLVISDGYFMIFGRQVANVGNTIVTVPVVQNGTLYSKLVFTINLALENTVETFTQGYFEIISDAAGYPALIQDDLDNGGTKYQMEFCKFENVISGVTNLVDTRTILDMNTVDADTVDNLHATDLVRVIPLYSVTAAFLNATTTPYNYECDWSSADAIGLAGVDWVHIKYIRHDAYANGYGYQEAIGINSKQRWWRQASSTSWGTWNRLYDSTNITASQTDLTAGSSALSTGNFYAVYE